MLGLYGSGYIRFIQKIRVVHYGYIRVMFELYSGYAKVALGWYLGGSGLRASRVRTSGYGGVGFWGSGV